MLLHGTCSDSFTLVLVMLMIDVRIRHHHTDDVTFQHASWEFVPLEAKRKRLGAQID